MIDKYILVDGKPVPEPDLYKWGAWLQTADRKIDRTEKDGITVSTVFLGLDHNWEPGGKPILFETMVFGGEHDQDMAHYSTIEEARAGHKQMCEMVFKKLEINP